MKSVLFVVLAVTVALAGCETSPDEQPDQTDEPAQAVEPQQDQPSEQADDDADEEEVAEDQQEFDEPAKTDDDGAPKVGERAEADDDFERQPHMDELRERADGADTTSWQESERQIPEQFTAEEGDGANTPGQLLMELAGEFRLYDSLGIDANEITARITGDGPERNIGILLQWGLKDDSVAGLDMRVRMQQVDGAWFVEELEERYHCRRGVTDDELCL